MELNRGLMSQYAEFLEENTRQIVELCNNVQEALAIARHCLDQSSGVVAAAELYNNMENIRKAVPIEDNAIKRLVLAKKYSMDAENVFRI